MDVSTPQCGGHNGCQYASVRWSLWMSVRLSAVVIMDVSTPQCGGHYGCKYASVRWSLWMSVRLSVVVIMDVSTPQCGGHYGCQYASMRGSLWMSARLRIYVTALTPSPHRSPAHNTTHCKRRLTSLNSVRQALACSLCRVSRALTCRLGGEEVLVGRAHCQQSVAKFKVIAWLGRRLADHLQPTVSHVTMSKRPPLWLEN